MSQETARGSRIDYIDGLRGMAIGLVLVHHAYMDMLHSGHRLGGPLRVVAWVGARGYLGVPLFFVLSGFCLSYPLLRRRAQGKAVWFTPSDFFARRCLRILPPYYAALSFFALLNVLVVAHLHVRRVWSITQPIDAPNLATHFLLIHNLTKFNSAINGPFWSLGLEWQWYWAFPFLLLLSIRFPRVALGACLVMTIAWHFLVQSWGQSMAYIEGMALPGTLLMFCLGIIVARIFVAEPPARVPPARVWLLALGTVTPILVAEIPLTQRLVGDLGLYESCYGLGFACLVLLGTYSVRVKSVLAWSPLVSLGLISYSVYLVHQPIMAAFSYFGQRYLHGSPLTMVLAIAVGVASGAIFYSIVERRCTQRETWIRVSPTLSRLFRWTDRLFGPRAGERVRTVPAPRLEGAEQLP